MKHIDPYLRQTLRTFIRNYFQARDNSFKNLDFEKLREELTEIRERALENNENLIFQFEKQAKRNGSKVIRAKDSMEANILILEILKKHNAKKLVKTKSMVSEETKLNKFLSERGILARETDLGEWIVQLAKDKPTHMVLPAIHFNRKEVAKIFSKELKKELTEDIPSLVKIAREELRKEIFDVTVGLTGANALIASTGSIMIVTNEGNARLVLTIPQVHIVLTTIEKLIPSVDDALVLLKLLSRSATGQDITSYVSFISGPCQSEQYIILLDNHRSEILADIKFREMLRCIKCSACLNFCPVYQVLGGKEFSHIYMGGIGSLLTAWIYGISESRELAELCMGCHQCEQACPTKIRIPELIVSLKERLNNELGKPLLKWLAFDVFMANPKFQEKFFKTLRNLGPIISRKDGFIRKMPFPLNKYDKFRALPAPQTKPLAILSRENLKKGKQKSLKLYAGCLVENFYPETGISAKRVLETLGYNVELVDTTCCGFPSANSGFRGSAKSSFLELSKKLKGEEQIITLCPTCTTMLTITGPNLIESLQIDSIAKRVVPFTKFIFEKEKDALVELFKNISSKPKLTYQTSCHYKNVLKAEKYSKELLKLVAGEEFIELDEISSCCGFAGIFSLAHPELSEALLEDKLDSIKRSEAEFLISDCPGCVLQIKGGCNIKNLQLKIMHTAQFLDFITMGANI